MRRDLVRSTTPTARTAFPITIPPDLAVASTGRGAGFRYRVGGVVVAADHDLPLPRSDDATTADWTVVWHRCDPPCSVPTSESSAHAWMVVDAAPGVRRYTFPGLARISVSEPEARVVMHPAARTQSTTIWHLLLDQVLPLELSERGELVVHASTVAVTTPRGRAAVLFLGDSGAGKSTTALACSLAGAEVIGDDFARLGAGDVRPVVFPAGTGLRLWDDAAAVVPDDAPRHPVAEYTSKVRVTGPPDRREELGREPVPVALLAILGERLPAEKALIIDPIAPSVAFTHVLRQSFGLGVPAPPARVRRLTAAASLADRVPAVEVRLPGAIGSLASVGADLVAALSVAVSRFEAAPVTTPRGAD